MLRPGASETTLSGRLSQHRAGGLSPELETYGAYRDPARNQTGQQGVDGYVTKAPQEPSSCLTNAQIGLSCANAPATAVSCSCLVPSWSRSLYCCGTSSVAAQWVRLTKVSPKPMSPSKRLLQPLLLLLQPLRLLLLRPRLLLLRPRLLLLRPRPLLLRQRPLLRQLQQKTRNARAISFSFQFGGCFAAPAFCTSEGMSRRQPEGRTCQTTKRRTVRCLS